MENCFHYADNDIIFHHTYDKAPSPEDFSKMHTHDFLELYYFISGSGVFKVEGSEYPLTRGDILIMRNHEAHCLNIDSSVPYERVAIHFNQNLFNFFDNDNLLTEPFYKREPGKLNIFHSEDFSGTNYTLFFNNMLSETDNKRVQLISNLAPLLNVIRNAYVNTDKSKLAQKSTLPYKIVCYVNENLYGNISLDSISKQFFLSKAQLCRIFKKATGSTIWEYITIKRLHAAKELILSGEAPTKACLKCGFNDYTVFYRAYKKRFNTSPKPNIK